MAIKFLSESYFFQASGSLTSLESQTRDPSLKSFPEYLCSSTSAGFEPANLGSRGEHVTPRPPRPISEMNLIMQYIKKFRVAVFMVALLQNDWTDFYDIFLYIW